MWVRGPLSDLLVSGESPHTREFGERTFCGEFALNSKECMEAYGHVRGMRYCKEFLEDWYECAYRYKSVSGLN